MSKTRESHKQALRQVLDRFGAFSNDEDGPTRERLIDEVLRVNDRFSRNPSLDEALNSGDGSYKP